MPKKIISNVKFAAVGLNGCSFIKNDGTVWTLGQNNKGFFGNGTKNDILTTIPQKMKGINSAVRIALNGDATLILLADGTLMSVGRNGWGTLGTNSPLGFETLLPIKIIDLKDIVDIKAGENSFIALDKNGFVYKWGYSETEKCGLPREVYKPTKINELKNIVAIAGSSSSLSFLAIDSVNNCYAWGGNTNGTLGYIETQKCYVHPFVLMKDVKDIMMGEDFLYLVKTDGTLWMSGAIYYEWSVKMQLKYDSSPTLYQLFPELPPINLCKAEPHLPKVYSHYNIQLCPNDSFKIGNKTYKKNINHKDTFKSIYGIDSVVSFDIKVNPILIKNNNLSICNGENYKIGKHTYLSTGIYKDTLSSQVGCDSIVITNLKIKPTNYTNQKFNICSNEFIKVGKNKYYLKGRYIDTLNNYLGCDSIIETDLNIFLKPKANFEINDNLFNINDTLFFNNTSFDSDNYKWYFSDLISETSLSKNPMFQYKYIGNKQIKLIAKNSLTNCSDTIIKTILIIDNKNIYIPSVFTPNADGINDYFLPYSKAYKIKRMKIFNSWGELVFNEEDLTKGWDGKYKDLDCQQDIYIFIVEVINNSNNKFENIKGIINLTR